MDCSSTHTREKTNVRFTLTNMFFNVKSPVKSTPLVANGMADSTRLLGSGGKLGVLYGFPITLAHMTHFLKIHSLMVGIQ